MIIYGSVVSPFVRKLLGYLGEKGIEFELKGVGIGDPDPGFRAASPLGKMPAMDDDGFLLADSSAIIQYVEAKHPEPALIPADPQERGTVIWWEEFGDTVFAACSGKMFFNRIVGPRFLGVPGDEEIAAKAECEELPPLLDYLEGVIPASGWLVEDRLTLADISVASPFANFRHLDVAIDPARHPKLLAYVEKVLARPSFAPMIEQEARFLERTAA